MFHFFTFSKLPLYKLSIIYKIYNSSVDNCFFEFQFPVAIGRGGKKSDVYRLGILVLSLSMGGIVEDLNVSKKIGLPDQLIDFINNCLVKDERERWSATQLLGDCNQN